jgi:hypothetical protein
MSEAALQTTLLLVQRVPRCKITDGYSQEENDGKNCPE